MDETLLKLLLKFGYELFSHDEFVNTREYSNNTGLGKYLSDKTIISTYKANTPWHNSDRYYRLNKKELERYLTDAK